MIPIDCRSEGLANRAVDLFADEAEHFGDTEIRRDGLRVGNGGDLAACIQMLGETFNRGISERRERGIVLVVVLQRQSVFRGWLVVEIGDGLIGDEIGGLGEKNILREIQRWA